MIKYELLDIIILLLYLYHYLQIYIASLIILLRHNVNINTMIIKKTSKSNYAYERAIAA